MAIFSALIVKWDATSLDFIKVSHKLQWIFTEQLQLSIQGLVNSGPFYVGGLKDKPACLLLPTITTGMEFLWFC